MEFDEIGTKERNRRFEEQQKKEVERQKSILKMIFWGIGIIVFIIVLFSTGYIVGAGERAVLVTLGNPSDSVISEGLHFKAPFIQSKIIFDIKTQKDEIEATAASKDLQTVSAKIAVNYHLQADSAPRIYREVGTGYVDRVLSPAIQESVKASTAQYTAEELITKRELVRETIKNLLVSKMERRGITIEDVLITNFDFSKSFNEAIEIKVTNEQAALAAKNKLQQIEYEAQQEITSAKGKAEAQRIQIESLKVQGGKEYVQLQAIARWSGNLPLVVGSNVMPFIGDITSNNRTQ